MNLLNYIKNVWILGNPTIVYRVIRGFVRAFIFNKNTLKTIEIFPTFKCNLKCKMCSMRKYRKNEENPLTLNHYRRLAKEGADLGAIAVTILGGEPMLSNNLEEIISIFKKEKFFVNMVSNGLLVNQENLKKLHNKGLNSIYFSLDSMDEKASEEIRGVKDYVKKVLRAVKIAEKEGFIVGLAPVFFHNQFKDGIDVIEYCKKHKIGASAGQVAAVGGAEDIEILRPAEHNRVRELLKFYPRLTFDWSLSYFLKMRCPAGKEKVAVTTYGDVIGCSVNPISFGNIKQESLENILKRMANFSQFAKDSPVCLSAEDLYYINNYLKPIKDFHFNPVNFKDHPKITKELEKEVYRY